MYTGIVKNIPNAVYHAQESLSHSLLKHLEPGVAPCQFWHHSWLNPHRTEMPSTTGMYFGSRMHDYMEDESTIHHLQVLPTVKCTKRAGFVGYQQLETMHILRKRLLAIPLVARAMEKGVPEVSLFADYQLPANIADAYGIASVPVRCRPDLLSDDVEIHWKFVSRIDPWSLSSLINRLRYIEGIAWYQMVGDLVGIGRRRRIIYFCETGGAHEIRPVEVTPGMLEAVLGFNEMCVERFCKYYSEFGAERWDDFSRRPQSVHMAGEGGSDSLILPPAFERRVYA
jgi:hypothetical protein